MSRLKRALDALGSMRFAVYLLAATSILFMAGALCYQFLIAPLEGQPMPVSKLNTACQLLFVLLAMAHAELAWPDPSVLTLLGAAVVFTSITSGLTYVLRWSRRAWRAAHASA